MNDLHLAAADGDLERLELALENCFINAIDEETGNTALHFAAQNGHMEIVQKLAEKGVNPTTRNNRGHTPIFLAVGNGHTALAKYILDYKPTFYQKSEEWQMINFEDDEDYILINSAPNSPQKPTGEAVKNAAENFR